MLPSAPFPDSIACAGRLREVIGIPLPRIGIGARRILPGLHVALVNPAGHTARYFSRHLGHAMQQHVAVAQQDAVMMVIPMAYLPQHLAVPIRFQDHAAFERKTTEKALL